MSSANDKLQEHAVAIKENEVNIKSIKEQVVEHCNSNKDELDKLDNKIEKNSDELVEVRGSVNLLAQEVKDLIILKNSVNAKVWKTIAGLILFAVLVVIVKNADAAIKLFGSLTKLGS